ncbi:MAG: extracellular solute-binding protein [Saccharofermentanales bacterium]
MKRKIILILLASLMVFAMAVTACNQATEPASSAGASSAAGTDPFEVTVFRSSDMSQGYSDALFVNHIKEKFNITLKYTYVPSSVATEKMNLAFATNTYDDMLELVGISDINRLAKDDFIIPMSDYIDNIPNYKNAYSAEDWDRLVDTISDAENRFFGLPVKEAMNSSSSWIWMFRNEEFEAVGMPVPKTVDELYQGLKKIKAEVNPNLTIPNRWGLLNALEGFNLAFRTRYDAWKDPDEGSKIVLGIMTDKFRDLLIYMHKLYKEDILSKEFVTMKDSQRMSQFSSGNVYSNFQFSGYEESLNIIAKAAKQKDNWEADVEHLVLTAYPDKGPMRQKWPAFYNFGIALTDKLEGDHLNRMLEYINWSCSEEGQLFHEFGVEGESFEIVDGIPVYIGKYLDATDPDSYFGLVQDYGPFGYFIIQNEKHAELAYPGPAKTNKDLEGVEEMDYSPIPYRFTEQEESRQADLGTVIDQISKEYIQAFIMGTKDPNSDSEWQAFLSALDNAGVEEYLEILRTANGRLG